MPTDAEHEPRTAYRIVLGIVLPFGSAMLAFYEIAEGVGPAMKWLMLLILVGGLFFAFNTAIRMLDERLNPKAQEVLG